MSKIVYQAIEDARKIAETKLTTLREAVKLSEQRKLKDKNN